MSVVCVITREDLFYIVRSDLARSVSQAAFGNTVCCSNRAFLGLGVSSREWGHDGVIYVLDPTPEQ